MKYNVRFLINIEVDALNSDEALCKAKSSLEEKYDDSSAEMSCGLECFIEEMNSKVSKSKKG